MIDRSKELKLRLAIDSSAGRSRRPHDGHRADHELPARRPPAGGLVKFEVRSPKFEVRTGKVEVRPPPLRPTFSTAPVARTSRPWSVRSTESPPRRRPITPPTPPARPTPHPMILTRRPHHRPASLTANFALRTSNFTLSCASSSSFTKTSSPPIPSRACPTRRSPPSKPSSTSSPPSATPATTCCPSASAATWPCSSVPSKNSNPTSLSTCSKSSAAWACSTPT